MNICTVVGRVQKDAVIRTTQQSGTRLLCATIGYEKVFPSGKRFTRKFKFIGFGKGIDEQVNQMKEGALVCVVGDVDIEPATEKYPASLKLIGRVEEILEEARSVPQPQKKEDFSNLGDEENNDPKW